MVKGLDTFQKYFADYEEQYVLIGGAACDILFESNEVNFRATRDLDMVLIIEALTPEFGEKFWEFIVDGKYRNKATNGSNPQFYRFDKPEDDNFPKMIELFCRSDFKLKNAKGITPIHIDDEVSSLSAILLNDDYYKALLNGKEVRNGLSVLRPEYIILFKGMEFPVVIGSNGESAHLGLLLYEFMCTTRARSTRVLQYCHFDNFVLLTSSRLDGDNVPIPT